MIASTILVVGLLVIIYIMCLGMETLDIMQKLENIRRFGNTKRETTKVYCENCRYYWRNSGRFAISLPHLNHCSHSSNAQIKHTPIEKRLISISYPETLNIKRMIA